MILISVGAMLMAWVGFIWLMDPDGVQKHTHDRWASRKSKEQRYY